MRVNAAPLPLYTFRQWGVILLMLVLLALPGQVDAQAHSLHVTLRDARGAAVSCVTVIVRSEDGQERARQVLGDAGSVVFADLPPVVRVAVDGQPRSGPRLYQLGADARGVRVVLDSDGTTLTLDLRAEIDGLVLPDPATMLTLEEGGPLVVNGTTIPTAAVATPALLPTARRTAITPDTTGSPVGAAPPQADWVPPVTVLILVVAACVLRLVQKLRSL